VHFRFVFWIFQYGTNNLHQNIKEKKKKTSIKPPRKEHFNLMMQIFSLGTDKNIEALPET